MLVEDVTAAVYGSQGELCEVTKQLRSNGYIVVTIAFSLNPRGDGTYTFARVLDRECRHLGDLVYRPRASAQWRS